MKKQKSARTQAGDRKKNPDMHDVAVSWKDSLSVEKGRKESDRLQKVVRRHRKTLGVPEDRS